MCFSLQANKREVTANPGRGDGGGRGRGGQNRGGYGKDVVMYNAALLFPNILPKRCMFQPGTLADLTINRRARMIKMST